MRLYLDIETIPDQREGAKDGARSRVRPPANYKDEAKIAAYVDEHADEQWRRTALDGTYGQICVVCWAVDDRDVRHTLAAPGVSEAELLSIAWSSLDIETRGQQPTIVGHNIGFDLTFLYRRSVINNVKPPFYVPHLSAPWQGRYEDTMYAWCGAKGAIKLTELCAALGVDADDDITGADVWDHWQAGDYETVVRHCVADVERVRQVYKRLRFE